jgi:hypothetical protein
MDRLNIIWEKIKNYWRIELHESEIYCDDNENIIIFNQSDDLKIIIGFQYTEGRFASNISHTKEFVGELRKLGSENYSSFKIYIITNYSLSNFGEPSDIMSLPSDVNYFCVRYNSYNETFIIEPENLSKSAEISYGRNPWYYHKGIEVITDSRFEDWDKWERKGYKRRWYNCQQEEKFDQDWDELDIIRSEVIFIDEGLLGFYVVWGVNELEKLLRKYLD